MKLSKAFLGLGLLMFVAGGVQPVFGVDNEVKASSDTSKNPITGTVTHTKKYKKKHKNSDGTTSEASATEKEKIKTDGSTSKTVDTEAETK